MQSFSQTFDVTKVIKFVPQFNGVPQEFFFQYERESVARVAEEVLAFASLDCPQG